MEDWQIKVSHLGGKMDTLASEAEIHFTEV